jgi:hypothetical protein
MRRSKTAALPYDLIGEARQRRGDRNAKRLGGLPVDKKLELGRAHDRQVPWDFALEDAADIGADEATLLNRRGPVS